ncbi:unnamed protein product [Calicophoron daubneyi]|uniref:Potassium voltage-gated channel subfamily H member 2 n=1 Tax=Calicophoron daubneyi TaxID=300641 RepID=A0AAV2SZ50_CALDB
MGVYQYYGKEISCNFVGCTTVKVTTFCDGNDINKCVPVSMHDSNFVLGNAQVRDYPIVYCSDGLVELTGYNRSQIMSRCCSCSFLWGEKTSEEAKKSIQNALHSKLKLQIEVEFHKKSGLSFHCLLDIVPIKNDKSQVVLFLVSHKEITASSKELSETDQKNENRLDGVHRLLHRFPPKRGDHSSTVVAHPSFLTAGLATTVTAAALGTTAFRRNKLLDYIHTSKLNIPANLYQRHYTPTGFPQSSEAALCLNRTHDGKNSLGSNASNGEHASLHDVSSFQAGDCEKALGFAPEPGSDKSSSDSSTDSSTAPASTTSKFQHRRSRAVLYHLSGRFDHKSKKRTPLKRIQRISGKETIPEYKVQDVQTSRFILLHYSIVKIIWDWLILICTFYIAIMVPYNAAFSLDTDGKDLLVCDIIVEILYIVDILLSFITTYVSKSGQVVYETRAIALNYLKGWFLLDLVAAIPFDIILAIHNRIFPDSVGHVGNWIHLLKMARLLRLARLFQKIERYSQYSTVVLGLLMGMFFFLAHWFACGWYWLGQMELNSSQAREYSWLVELARRMHLTLSDNQTYSLSRRAIYVSSLYFTTTSLTSIGFGNVSPNTVNEKIYSIITMLIGALMHAAVFGNVTTIIQRMYFRRSAYQLKNQDLKDFTRTHHIPKPLKQRMQEFFQAMWAINRGIDNQAIMQTFPENVRGDIALHLNREMLSLPLFKTASPGCKKSLAQLISTRFATPGECLVNQGDLLRHIYFVCSGSLEVLGADGNVAGLLGKADIFGSDIDSEPSLGYSAYDVKSLTYCELQCLPLDSEFFKVLEEYPNFRDEFAEALREELSFNIREGFDNSALGNNSSVHSIGRLLNLSSAEILPAVTVGTSAESSGDEGSIQMIQEPVRNSSFNTKTDKSIDSAGEASLYSTTPPDMNVAILAGFLDSSQENRVTASNECNGLKSSKHSMQVGSCEGIILSPEVCLPKSSVVEVNAKMGGADVWKNTVEPSKTHDEALEEQPRPYPPLSTFTSCPNLKHRRRESLASSTRMFTESGCLSRSKSMNNDVFSLLKEGENTQGNGLSGSFNLLSKTVLDEPHIKPFQFVGEILKDMKTELNLMRITMTGLTNKLNSLQHDVHEIKRCMKADEWHRARRKGLSRELSVMGGSVTSPPSSTDSGGDDCPFEADSEQTNSQTKARSSTTRGKHCSPVQKREKNCSAESSLAGDEGSHRAVKFEVPLSTVLSKSHSHPGQMKTMVRPASNCLIRQHEEVSSLESMSPTTRHHSQHRRVAFAPKAEEI